MTKQCVYRGVTYTKNAGKNTAEKSELCKKLYRGAAYTRIPHEHHEVCDHVYRGAHYMS